MLEPVGFCPCFAAQVYSYSFARRFVSNPSSVLGFAQGLSIHDVNSVFIGV
jgi:hypothetical protein